MTKNDYAAMQDMYQTNYMQAWQYILDNWNCTQWQAIPNEIKSILHLPPTIGLCSNMLVTRTGASGLNEFVNRINKRNLQ